MWTTVSGSRFYFLPQIFCVFSYQRVDLAERATLGLDFTDLGSVAFEWEPISSVGRQINAVLKGELANKSPVSWPT